MSQMEDPRLEKRLTQDAENILKQDLHRRKWQAKDRNSIAERLRNIIIWEGAKQRP